MNLDKTIVLAFLLAATPVAADVLRPQCQTEETRGLRFTADAMRKAAAESDPWQGCSYGCSRESSVADSMHVTQKRFEAEAAAALYKARALEAARCPDLAGAIINNSAANEQELQPVREAFLVRQKKEWDEFRAIEKWRVEHPQCRHVMQWSWKSVSLNGVSDSSVSVDDFSGHALGVTFNPQREEGYCTVDGAGPVRRGTADDLSKDDPAQNKLILKVDCATSLRENGFDDGPYANPALCTELAQ